MLKYIGVGLSKTGTSSLCEAFKILGFKSRHYLNKSSYRHLIARTHGYDYDFVDDIPVCSPHRYKQLSGITPNIKAILTIRNVDDWIESCRTHWATHTLQQYDTWEHWRVEIYGIPHFDEDIFRTVYYKHIDQVHEFFSPDKLLVMDITAGDGWDKLCPFVGLDMPDCDFPNVNKTVKT